MRTTISVYAIPVGGVCETTRVFPDILQTAAKMLKKEEGAALIDSYVTHAADRLVLMMTHNSDVLPEPFIAEVFLAAQEISAKRHLFCGNDPVSLCRMTIEERENEPLLLFMAGSDVIPWGEVMIPNQNTVANGVLFLTRAGGDFPTTSEFCERFARRGLSEQGVCPVSLCDSSNVRTTVIPVVGLGFSIWNGKLTGPVDLFDTPLFDAPRFWASDRRVE
ncbi:MAG TPA: fructose 1,6-bisphosphatase [Methanocorpusculum sp.]|nr:fructose 1,6-bisphosphatase [Methanocorpusculum sp.]